MTSNNGNDDKPLSKQWGKAGRDNQIVGGNYTNTTSVNVSVWISIVVIIIVALGSYVLFNPDGFLPPSNHPTPTVENS